MTDRRNDRTGRLSHQLLGVTAISILLAVVLFFLLLVSAGALVELYLSRTDTVLTEAQWMGLDSWVFFVSTLISAVFFVLLFLFLLGDRLSYIRQITRGIDTLRMGQQDHTIPLAGNNELTELARAINEMSAAQRQLREKEQALQREKEQLIRTLSHDIRTPLTSILSYSDFYSSREQVSDQELAEYFATVRRKAEQIRELTDVLLEGGKRSPERFDDARLLMEQLASEFEEGLEERFAVVTDLTQCPPFAGSFDVQELRRIFDNLSSNVQKYADPRHPVRLTVRMEDRTLTVGQENAVLPRPSERDSYKLGIPSIRRIAQSYGGQVTVRQDGEQFAIAISFSDF